MAGLLLLCPARNHSRKGKGLPVLAPHEFLGIRQLYSTADSLKLQQSSVRRKTLGRCWDSWPYGDKYSFCVDLGSQIFLVLDSGLCYCAKS